MIAFPLTIFAASSVADSHDPIIETWHAAIEARDGQRLRLVIANEGQPALLFKSVAGAWDWAATSKLSIPVENPGDEALTLSLRIDSDPDRSLSGKVAIAPHSAGDLAIWIAMHLRRGRWA